MTTHSTTPPPDAGPASDAIDVVDARIAMLWAEAEIAGDPTIRAAIHYEIGLLYETERGEEAQAVKQYLSAYNANPSFSPPLNALVRIFERRRSFQNLIRLYEAQAKHGESAPQRAAALVEQAVLFEDHLGQPDLAPSLYRSAIEADPEGAQLPALYLERSLLARGELDALVEVLAKRAELVSNPLMKGLLWVEVAEGLEQRGDIEGALAAARHAMMLPLPGDRFVVWFEELARRHGAHAEVASALETRAAISERRARGEDEHRESEIDRSREVRVAAALYREAAQLRLFHAQGGERDAKGALANLDRAIALCPEDVALHRDRMIAAECAGELSASADEARWLLSTRVIGRHAAALHFRVAEEAQARGARDEARAALDAAREADPNSSVIAATREELLADAAPGDALIEAWLSELERGAEAAHPEARAGMLWKAAHVAATRSRDAKRAGELYAAAYRVMAEHGLHERSALVRDWQGTSLRFDHVAGVRDATQVFLALASDFESQERGAVLRDWLEIERRVGDAEGFAAALDCALEAPEAAEWAPELARIHAAACGDLAMLARAHQSLARRGTGPEREAAHLCLAARALVRQGDLASAKMTLTQALSSVPGHRYAMALLEEIHRASGDSEALVHLLRERAETEGSSRDAETSLLLAGAEAESTGNTALAIRTYEEALERDPTALGPLLALRRLAERTRDDALMLEVLERLTDREIGPAGNAMLELGEHLHMEMQDPARAESPLRIALGMPSVSTFAALDLALLGASQPAALLDGMKQLLDALPVADDPDVERTRMGLLRELGGIELDLLSDPSAADGIAAEILKRDPKDPWAFVTRWRTRGVHRAPLDSRPEAFLALAEATSDERASAELIVHALRGYAIAGTPSDEAVIRATELAEAQPDDFLAALAGLEALGDADDPGERAEALGRWIPHASPESQASFRAARGRALAAAGRGAEACDELRFVLEAEPTDLASWDALRVAARDAERWGDLVRACDELASVLTGELRAALLEEGAAVLMDQLGRDDEAEKRFRAALVADGACTIAYSRLHDLLADRRDDAGLVDLVKERAELTDDPELLSPLLYELARLHRGLGQRDEALLALDDLLMLEPEHVGGLALLVELHAQREAWAEAVDALRMLAGIKDVPVSQKRIARLGAADFLEKKLDDPKSALAELDEVDALGLADRALYMRMADIAERAGSVERATASLRKAAELAREHPEEAAAIERRAARLWLGREGMTSEVIAAYSRALSAHPTDLESAVALSRSFEGEELFSLSRRFEASLRRALDDDPTDPELLRGLAMAAQWRSDEALATTAFGALVGLGVASDEERHAWEARMPVSRALSGQLSERRMQEMAVSGFGGELLDLARLANEVLGHIDKLEPSRFGFSRGELTQPKTAPRVVHELVTLTSRLGAPSGDVWVGGADPQLFAMIPSFKGRPAWLLGSSVLTPFSSARLYELGRRAVALRLGIGAFLSRDIDEGALALMAIARAAGASFSSDHPGLPEASRAMGKAMSRGTRKAVAEIAARVPHIESEAHRFMNAAHQTLRRAGLLVSMDLPVVLERVLGSEPSRALVRADDGALDLLRDWISRSRIEARHELGGAS